MLPLSKFLYRVVQITLCRVAESTAPPSVLCLFVGSPRAKRVTAVNTSCRTCTTIHHEFWTMFSEALFYDDGCGLDTSGSYPLGKTLTEIQLVSVSESVDTLDGLCTVNTDIMKFKYPNQNIHRLEVVFEF